jgi:starch synthase (maltosyl-transferring)
LKPWPTEPVAVALVITDLDVGGAERALVALATGLDRSRWRPKVFCLGKPGALVHKLESAQIPCECLNASPRNPAWAIGGLAFALCRFRPRIVQSFLFHANLAARLAARLAGFPLVLSGIRVAERRKEWHLRLDHATARLVTGYVCVSRGVARFSVDVARLDLDDLVVIPNGIDTTPYEEAQAVGRKGLGIPEHAHLAIFVGRLDAQKGLPDLLSAAERVIAERPDWYLAIVGDGPERPWLIEQISTRPLLRDRVHFLGHRSDVPSLLAAADMLVLPSLWEGMPNVILEAMAAGLPVIGTAVEGTDELVIPGESGWLVPTHDPAALAATLIDAANSPETAKRFGQAGYCRIKEHFSLDATVRAYEKLWAGLLRLKLPTS